MKVSIRETKNGLSKVLKYVQTGHEVIVTEHGRPIAHLSVINDVAEPKSQALQRLRSQPWIRQSASGKVKGARTPL